MYSSQDGNTPLHIASRMGKSGTVQHLLSLPGINVNIKNVNNQTPIMLAQDYRVLRLLEKYMKCCDDFPVHTITKVVLCGNTGAGKSTLAQVRSIFI